MHLSKNTIFISGGSSGIGLALAKRLAKDNDVIICGRDTDKLKAVKAEIGDVQAVRADLKDEVTVHKLAQKLQDKHVNIVINNAGILYTNDTAPSLQKEREMIDVNFFAPYLLSKLLLPFLETQDNAAIVNVTSVAADTPSKEVSVYAASKAALRSHTQSLRNTTAVKIVEVIPPMVDTPMTAQWDGKKLKVDDVAETIIQGLLSGDEEIRFKKKWF